ncbi:hypothetical protein [Streptomyces sp. NPDC048191]|uniref:hypothetical protein n=1 Tax=Streptomyces sp. NPDC048191 TaxID=3155484 RepID=UPI0033DEC5D1
MGGITGTVRASGTLLIGRYDNTGHLRLVARTTPLPTAARRDVDALLAPGGPITLGAESGSPPGGAVGISTSPRFSLS